MTKTIQNLIQDQYENHILPFFWQHGEEESTLREYMRAISEANIGAVCVESRPHPDFAGPKWWKDLDVILDEARKRNMKVWILDDSHFPTGFANGAMKQEPLSKARRSLTCQKYEIKAGEILFLSAEEVKHAFYKESGLSGIPFLKKEEKEEKKPRFTRYEDDSLVVLSAFHADGQREELTTLVAPDGSFSYCATVDTVLYKINQTRDRGAHPDYINMLEADSVRVLIDAVYEPHFAHYSEDFGKTIAGFFSDEPELGNGPLYDMHAGMGRDDQMDYPYSETLITTLKEKLGAEFALQLPLLWENDRKDNAAAMRLLYMEELSHLVEKNFSQQLGDWCRSHGVKYIGHLIEDNGMHCRTGCSLGHYFRGLRGQDWAGIDDIGGQVFPKGEDISYDRGIFQVRNGEFFHFMLGKLASSLAAIDEKKKGNSMCEIFGNYGWSEGLRLEKYLIDHFIVRGINHYVPHAFSAAPFPDPDCPPHFYAQGHNPQYRHFGNLMIYMNRLSELISGGHSVSCAAVLYHAEGEWTGQILPDEKIARKLTEHQIDFNFIPADVFDPAEGYRTTVENGKLKVNTQEYDLVIVPYMEYMTATLAEALVKLQEEGITILFVGGKPGKVLSGEAASEWVESWDSLGQKDCQCVSLEELPQAAAAFAEITLEPSDPFIHYYHYVKPDQTELFILINENDQNYEGKLSFRTAPEGKAYFYDAWNQILQSTAIEENQLQFSLKAGENKVLIFSRDPEDQNALEKVVRKPFVLDSKAKRVSFEKEWKRSICKSMEYPNFGAACPITLPDPLSKEQREFSGWIRYENSFISLDNSSYSLEITEAFEGVEVYVNGVNLGLQILPPYQYDLSRAVKAGENQIRIEISTTLEREMLSIPNPFTGEPNPEPSFGSGITGEVILQRQ